MYISRLAEMMSAETLNLRLRKKKQSLIR